jgi:chromosome segregation and condensation protein ScpB
MDLVLRIPDDLAARLGATSDLSRQALETLAAEAYRAGRLTRPELRRFLGFGTRPQVDAFLKARGIDESMMAAEYERDRQDLDKLGL